MKTRLVIFMSICSLWANAQEYVDLVKMFYANTPVNQFDTATNGSRVEEYGIDAIVPLALKHNNYFLAGLYAENITAKISPESSNLTSVKTVNIKLGLQISHSKKWTGTYVLLPKLSSDFKAIGARDFQMGAFALLKYKKSEKLNYRFGAYYNSELFGPFFVPILGMYYKSATNKFEMTLNLPLSADLNYTVLPKVKAGASFFAFVRTYNLNENYQGTPDHYLAKSTNEIYAYLQFEPAKGFLFQAKLGYSIGRNYRVYQNDDQVSWGLSAFKFGDHRKQLNADFSDGLVFRFKFIYRFYLEE